MQLTWVIKNNSDKLILFFNGWSLDEIIVKHLSTTNFDVLMFNDYSNLEIEEKVINKINSYAEVNVIAWSFGVWACANVINKFDNLNNAIAVNGTLVPINNNLGIPEKIFNLTLQHLSEENYVRFFKNMFSGEADLSKISTRSIENKKHELEQIKNLSVEKSCKQNVKSFNKVYIGNNDKIISARNQLNFWGETNAQIIKIESGHYLFDSFISWDEILNG